MAVNLFTSTKTRIKMIIEGVSYDSINDDFVIQSITFDSTSTSEPVPELGKLDPAANIPGPRTNNFSMSIVATKEMNSRMLTLTGVTGESIQEIDTETNLVVNTIVEPTFETVSKATQTGTGQVTFTVSGKFKTIQLGA